MNKMQSWFGGLPAEVLTDPETQSDNSGSPIDASSPSPRNATATQHASSSRPPPSPANNLSRLPSDDTLNRSSHGAKSSVEELRTANSALMHQLSAQEASFMNQLTQITSEFKSKEEALKKELAEMANALQVSQNRVGSVERRIRERDAQLTSCKEEKGKMGCQITDLKNQLYQLQFEIEETSADKADCIQTYESKLTDATRSLDEMKRALDEATNKQVTAESRADDLQKDKEKLEQELEETRQEKRDGASKTEEYSALLKKCQELEQYHAKLQNDRSKASPSNATDNEALQQQLATLRQTNSSLTEQLSASNLEITHAKQLSQSEISNLRSMLRARDDAIQSLQQRLERATEEMTTLEAEVDVLRENAKLKEEKGQGEVGNLWKLNDEMAKIIEKQSKRVEDLNEKLEKRKVEYEEQLAQVVQSKERVIGELQTKLESKELDVVEKDEQLRKLQAEIEGANENMRGNNELKAENAELRAQLVTAQEASSSATEAASTHHRRVSSLECELQEMKEKVDELNDSLTEAVEEISSLQADIALKEARIATLEEELEEASSLLGVTKNENEAPPTSTSDKEPGNFARLRREIENVTRERVRLESEHTHEIAALESKLQEANEALAHVKDQLKEETERVQSMKLAMEQLEKSKMDLTRDLGRANDELNIVNDSIDEELEECKEQIQQLQDENSDLQAENDDLRKQLSITGSEELLEAKEALTALDEEKSEALRNNEDRIESLTMELSECKEQVMMGEAKLNRAIREREFIISDLKKEVDAKENYAAQLKAEVEALQLTVERNNSPSARSKRSFGMAIDPDCDDNIDVQLSKLKHQASSLEREKNMIEHELRAKIEDRDATISKLVITSSNQEETIVGLKKEVARLQVQLDTKTSSDSFTKSQMKGLEAMGLASNECSRREVESLKAKLRDMSAELSRANRKLSVVSQELERAKDQLSTTQTTQDVSDLAGRLAVADQAQRLLKKDNEEKIQERDSAISNLLQTVQANEKVILKLKSELEQCKKNVSDTLEENRRLRHESEIFAAQIIDQDAEFAELNAKLKEKNAEIASMQKDVASSKLDARKIASLQRRLDDMKNEKDRQSDRVNELTQQLKKAESKKAEVDKSEVERFELELRKAKMEKEAVEEKLTKQIESLRKLRNHAFEEFEAKLSARDEQISALEKELLDLKEKALSSTAFAIDLNGKPAPTQDQLDELTDKCVELGDERDSLKVKIATLNREIETLRASSETKLISELRSKLAQSEAMRESLEKNQSMFNSSRDAEIDRLHKQLAEAKEKQTSRELEQLARLKNLEKDNRELREDFSTKVKEKNAKIIALEQTLAAQEQVVGNMSNEMDQLQNGMEKISIQRRAEIEEMQQELMDYTSKAARLEREVASLSMTLNEKKLKHKDEVAKLKERIIALESESPLSRTICLNDKDNDREKNELAEKIEHMKWLNSSLKDENDKLREKLEDNSSSTKKADDASASAKNNDKWRNVALQEQVAVLSQRVIELEEAAASRRTPGTPRISSILESPVMRSSLGNNNAPATPRSALRVSSYDEINQANDDLLSNPIGGDRAPTDGLPPALPNRRSSPSRTIPKGKSSKPPKIGFNMMKRSSSYKMSPRGSPRSDDASNSTTNYNF
eukprot:CCRYP_013682-RA/>CCRYP_013682-RA protein AED:0.01 eAED:0.01 QI:340/1/1/1/1/1/2/85/1637